MPVYQICLTTIPPGYGSTGFFIYADPTGPPPSNGTLLAGPINVSNLTGANCPYTVSSPTNVSTFRIIETNGTSPIDCYTDLSATTFNFCDNCNFSFTNVTQSGIGTISVGNLISVPVSGSTEPCNLQGYVVYWYDQNNVLSFISCGPSASSINQFLLPNPLGPGNATSNYTHPLTGAASASVPPGQYTPIIVAIRINNINFIRNGYEGVNTVGIVSDNFECLTGLVPEFTVLGASCQTETPTSNYPQYYTYRKLQSSFASASPSAPIGYQYLTPDPTTKYIAFAFKTELIADRLTVRFFGSNYSFSPITLEDITVTSSGSNIGLNNPTITPKQVNISNNNYFRKVIPISGLTIDPTTDFIEFKITPNVNQTSTQTNWDLYYTCLDEFDCTLCDNLNDEYKICADNFSVSYTPDSICTSCIPPQKCLYDDTEIKFKPVRNCVETNFEPLVYLNSNIPFNGSQNWLPTGITSAYTYSVNLGGGNDYYCNTCNPQIPMCSFTPGQTCPPDGWAGNNGYYIQNLIPAGCWNCTASQQQYCTGQSTQFDRSIRFTKDYNPLTNVSTIVLEFGANPNSPTDRTNYISNWNSAVLYYWNGNFQGPAGVPTPQDAKWYRWIKMAVPLGFGSVVNSGPNTACGDNVEFYTDIYIHPTAVMDTSNPDTIVWTWSAVTNNYVSPATGCGTCSPSSPQQLINTANAFAQKAYNPTVDPFTDITNNTCPILDRPYSTYITCNYFPNYRAFYGCAYFKQDGPSAPSLTGTTLTSNCYGSPYYSVDISKYSQTLHAFSGSTPIPALSGEVCDFSSSMNLQATPTNIIACGSNYPAQVNNDFNNMFVYRRLKYWYKWYLVNPTTDDRWVRLVTRDIDSNGLLTGPEVTIFERDTTSIIVPPTNPTYFECIQSNAVNMTTQQALGVAGTNPMLNANNRSSSCTPSNIYCIGGCQNRNPQISWTLTNGLNYFDVTNYGITCEKVGIPGSGPNGWFLVWNVTNINPIAVPNIPANYTFGVNGTINPTDCVGGVNVSSGWCGSCPTTTAPPLQEYLFTITVNLEPGVGGGTLTNTLSMYDYA
jgi:hypothetical protein